MYYGFVKDSTVSAGAPYLFTTKYLTNTNIGYNPTTGVFTFREPGWYEISFSTSGAANNLTITPTLVINGEHSTHVFAQATSTATTDFVSASFNTVLYIQPSVLSNFATIQVIDNGGAEVVENANIIIKRIG